jgi:nitrous oxidase accessory protein NosD
MWRVHWVLAVVWGIAGADCVWAEVTPPKWVPKAPALGTPVAGATTVRVTTAEQLYRAVESAKPGTTIMVADGHYAMPQYLEIRADDVTLRGESGDRDRVVLDRGLSRSGEVIGVGGCAGVTVADLTIQNARTNAFKINSDRFATKVTLRNCVIHNAWQRGVKGVAVRAADRERFRPSDCRIEYCLFYNDRPKRFEDDPDDTAANFGGNYIGGIDAMYARRWTICDNVFIGIHGRTSEARGAVFLWQGAEGCTVERNVIVDCDSGVCLGNSFKPAEVAVHCTGCVVRNNFVTRCPEQGILADYTRDCRIVHNTVFEPGSRLRRLVRLVHDNGGLVVANNLLDGAPVLVESKSDVSMSENMERDLAKWCVDVASGDLHLRPDAPVERAMAVEGVSEDFDRQHRAARPNVGADELPK